MRKIRVMVVDDEPIAARAIAYMIEQGVVNVEIVGLFHSGREAIRQVDLLRPEIVIMDIQMPGINGLEAMRQIKIRDQNVRFIIISAYQEFHYATQALELGACDYLLKPVKQTAFTSALYKVIQDIGARNDYLDYEMEQRERMELATPIIKKDFLRSLLPGADASACLISCAAFLGYEEKTGYVFVVEGDAALTDEKMQRLLRNAELKSNCDITLVQQNQAVGFVYDADDTSWLYTDGMCNAMPVHMGIGGVYKGTLQMRLSCAEAFLAVRQLRSEPYADNARHLLFSDATAVKGESEELYIDRSQEIKSRQDIIEKAEYYIARNYTEDVALEDVAAYVNLSPFYFSRLYKSDTGKKFSEKLTEVRIQKAKEFLRQPNSSIKDVAYSVGYNDPNYFSKVFHKITGMTASQYKEG